MSDFNPYEVTEADLGDFEVELNRLQWCVAKLVGRRDRDAYIIVSSFNVYKDELETVDLRTVDGLAQAWCGLRKIKEDVPKPLKERAKLAVPA